MKRKERIPMYKNNDKDDKLSKKNAEGYPDPTAYYGIKQAEYNEANERHYKLLGAIFRICELAGFRVEERIVLKDIKTGRVWY